MTAEELAVLIRSTRLRFGTESDLQDDLEKMLTAAGVVFIRECRLTKRHTIDFWIEGGIGVECKVDGSVSEIAPQLMNYAESPKVETLLLVTSRARHRFQTNELRGKPFGVVWVGASSL